MKVLVAGDLFITTNILQSALEEAFANSDITFDYLYATDNWPVEPIQANDEVREFVGDDAEIAALVKDVEMIVTHTAPITRRVLAAAEKLQVIGAARGGPVNINVKACTGRGIPVLYAPGRNSGAVAEFTVALMLAETRSIVRAHESLMRERRWRGDLYVLERVGSELNSSLVGLVGFGAIGRKVATILGGFGAHVLVYDPYVPEEEIAHAGCEAVSLERLLSEADIVSLHCRLTPETRGMIGAREIGLMKPGAYLVNTARGELIQHEDLYTALKARRIAGAALDVFEAEPPPPDSMLYDLENVTVATHLGGASLQAAQIGACIMAEELYRYLTGAESVRYCANPEVLVANP